MTKFSRDTENFISEYAKAIINGNASVFVGAGLSRDAGYLGWADFLTNMAAEIGLDVKKESDLISLAQYYINKRQRTKINNSIKNFFALKNNIVPTQVHNLLSALPIKSYWTTNYDQLLEKTFEQRRISYCVYFSDENLSLLTDNAQVFIHKMHGDVENPNSAVIAKEDYEKYDDTHEMMLAKFKGEMCSKTFLFLGYSFSDPNIHHILARIRKIYDKNAKQHYCIMKRVPKTENGIETGDYDYKVTKQNLQVEDFMNYGINVILVDDYTEIVDILAEIRRRVFARNVLICGAYEDNTINKDNIAMLAMTLTAWLIERGFNVYSGFGKNLGGHVVKGAFDGCTFGDGRKFNRCVSLFPFPYNVKLSQEERAKLYTQLRENMIINTHITLVIAGEKKNDQGELIPSSGVVEEVKISKDQGNLIIPIASSGGVAKIIWEQLKSEEYDKYSAEDFNSLNQPLDGGAEILKVVQKIITSYVQ